MFFIDVFFLHFERKNVKEKTATTITVKKPSLRRFRGLLIFN
jgi:hypothetical protein